jgi:hypothetical protein
MDPSNNRFIPFTPSNIEDYLMYVLHMMTSLIHENLFLRQASYRIFSLEQELQTAQQQLLYQQQIHERNINSMKTTLTTALNKLFDKYHPYQQPVVTLHCTPEIFSSVFNIWTDYTPLRKKSEYTVYKKCDDRNTVVRILPHFIQAKDFIYNNLRSHYEVIIDRHNPMRIAYNPIKETLLVMIWWEPVPCPDEWVPHFKPRKGEIVNLSAKQKEKYIPSHWIELTNNVNALIVRN